MPKVVVTEAELKQIIETVLSEQDGEVPDSVEAGQNTDTDEADVLSVIDPSLLRGPKLDLIGKLADIDTAAWSNRLSTNLEIKDLKSYLKINGALDPEKIIDTFLNWCVYNLLKGEEVVLGLPHFPATYNLALTPVNSIIVKNPLDVYFLLSSDANSEAQKVYEEAEFNVHDLVDGTDSFYNSIVVPGQDLNKIVAGLKKDKTASVYEYTDPGARQKFDKLAKTTIDQINESISVLNEKYNTATYRDYLYQPLLAPLTWFAVPNKDTPYYTPWKMTWAASNLFYKALRDDDVGGLRSMLNSLVEYSKKADGSQKTFRPSPEALNEEFGRFAVMHRDELRRVINASLEIKLNEAPTNKSGMSQTLQDLGSSIMQGLRRAPTAAEEPLLQALKNLDDAFRAGLRQKIISFEDLSDPSKTAIKVMSGAGNDPRVIDRIFTSINDNITETLTDQIRNFGGFTISGSAASQDAQKAYNLLLNTVLRRAVGVDIPVRDLAEITRVVSSLSDRDKDELKRMMDKVTDTSRSATADSTMSLSSASLDKIWNESFGKRLAEANSAAGVSKIERVGDNFTVTYTNNRSSTYGKSAMGAFMPNKDPNVSAQSIIDNADAAIKDAAATHFESIHDNQVNKLIDHLLDPKTNIRDSLSAVTGTMGFEDINRNLLLKPQMPDMLRRPIEDIMTAFDSSASLKERINAFGRLSSTGLKATEAYVFPVGTLVARPLARQLGLSAGKTVGAYLGVLTAAQVISLLVKPDLSKEAGWLERAAWATRFLLSSPGSYTTADIPGTDISVPVFSIVKELAISYQKFPLPAALTYDLDQAAQIFVNAFASLGKFAVYDEKSVDLQFNFQDTALSVEDKATATAKTAFNYAVRTARQSGQSVQNATDYAQKFLEGGADPTNIAAFAESLPPEPTLRGPTPGAEEADLSEKFVDLEDKRLDVIYAVESCLSSIDKTTLTFKDLGVLSSALSGNKNEMIKNYSRDIESDDAELFFTDFSNEFESYLTEENIIGLAAGIGTTRDNRRELLLSTHYYLDQTYPNEMEKFRSDLAAVLKNQSPEDARKTLLSVEKSFTNIAQAWALAATDISNVAKPAIATQTK